MTAPMEKKAENGLNHTLLQQDYLNQNDSVLFCCIEFLHDFTHNLLVAFLVLIKFVALACVSLCCFYWVRIRGKPNNGHMLVLRERPGPLPPVLELELDTDL